MSVPPPRLSGDRSPRGVLTSSPDLHGGFQVIVVNPVSSGCRPMSQVVFRSSRSARRSCGLLILAVQWGFQTIARGSRWVSGFCGHRGVLLVIARCSWQFSGRHLAGPHGRRGPPILPISRVQDGSPPRVVRWLAQAREQPPRSIFFPPAPGSV